MHIHDHFAVAGGTTLSFEFFPPRTPQASQKLQHTLSELAPLQPDFASVTYGAGGSTRDLTSGLVEKLQRSDRFPPIPHLTCVGHTRAEIQILLEHYASLGVSNILAMRGDLPPGQEDTGGDFAHAADLVRFIKEFNECGQHPDPRGFGIGVACFPEGHPSTPNRLKEMDFLKAKIDAGADYLCTQVFFENRDFYDFRERCYLAGIDTPILAGILPLTTESGMRRMAELAGGMRYPAQLLKKLQEGDFRQAALEHAIAQSQDLITHDVDGLHLYTLNEASPVKTIVESLKDMNDLRKRRKRMVKHQLDPF